MRRRHDLRTAALLVALAGWGAAAYAQPERAKSGIEPRADKILREMGRFLGEQSTFTVDASTRIEGTEASEPERREAQVALVRPDKLRVDSRRDGKERHLYYDGKSFTVTMPQTNTYATTPAPPTLDQTLEVVGQKLEVYPPGVDLLYQDPYRAVTESANSGKWLGETKMDGVVVDRIGLTGQDVDSEIWIQRGEQPVPRKYVVISKDLPGKPRYVVELKNWEFPKQISPETFAFKAPEGAQRVSFLSAQPERQRRVGRRGAQP